MAVAGNIAGAARSGTSRAGRVGHGCHHGRVLAHAEIIVRAPDDDLAGAVRVVPDGVRETAGEPLDVGEHAVAPLVLQGLDGVTKKGLVIHRLTGREGPPARSLRPWRLPV